MKFLSGWLAKPVAIADGIGKLGAGILVSITILAAIPIVDGYVKAGIGLIFGVTGAVYYEVGPNGDAMFASINEDSGQLKVDGGLFLLRNGDRDFDDLGLGDILQAGTAKNFRTTEGDPSDVVENPKMFVLNRGECVVVLSRFLDSNPFQARSGGWLKVATTSCGLFR